MPTPVRPHRRARGGHNPSVRVGGWGNPPHDDDTGRVRGSRPGVRAGRRLRGDPHRVAFAPHEGLAAGFGRGASGPGRSHRFAGGSCRDRCQLAGGDQDFAHTRGAGQPAPSRRVKKRTRPPGVTPTGERTSRAKGNNQRSTTGGWSATDAPGGAPSNRKRRPGRSSFSWWTRGAARVCAWTRPGSLGDGLLSAWDRSPPLVPPETTRTEAAEGARHCQPSVSISTSRVGSGSVGVARAGGGGAQTASSHQSL